MNAPVGRLGHGPATHAARRDRESRDLSGPVRRPYPAPADPDEATGAAAVLAATRALLTVETRAEAAAVLRAAVHDLGAGMLPARLAGSDAIQVDVSLGVGEPQVIMVDPLSVAALRLASHLPMLVQDALVAAARCDHAQRQDRRASVDSLTGVATRAEIGLRLGLALPGDVVCLFDLDGFKRLNDTLGHAAGDEALRRFGALLRAGVREGDFCGRYGGDEFVIVLAAASLDVARDRMSGLAVRWSRAAGASTTVSIGMAVVDARGAPRATGAADKALYRAKRQGRNRVEVAGPDDYGDADHDNADQR